MNFDGSIENWIGMRESNSVIEILEILLISYLILNYANVLALQCTDDTYNRYYVAYMI